MKLKLVFLMFFSGFCSAEEFYIGFQIEAFSRGGLIAGYEFNDKNSVELHLNGPGHVLSYGISYKNHYSEKNYLILGYTNQYWFNVVEGSTTIQHGLNLGIGHEFGSRENGKWSYPVEIGGGPGYDPENKQWRPLFFLGYGAIYN